jgi:hypothetical protein
MLMADPNTDEKPTPVLFEHCVRVYYAMRDQATWIPRESEVMQSLCTDHGLPTKDCEVCRPDAAEELDHTYEGKLTKLFQELYLSAPLYTSVMNALKTMGCVVQTRRGGGSAPSRWVLLQEPNEETFRDIQIRKAPVKGRVNELEQRMRDMNTRLLRVERAVGL